MNIIKDVLAELLSMFVGDARLTASILAVVGLSAMLIAFQWLQPLVGGVFLLFGCILVLVAAVRREAVARNRST